MEPRSLPADRRDSRSRAIADRQAGSGTRNRFLRRDATRPRRALRRDTNRTVCRARQFAFGLALQEQAWAMTHGQLAWYRAMEERGEMTPIVDRAALDRHLARWQQTNGHDGPIGYVLSLEGADSIVTLAHLERAYAQGLRAV